LRRDLVETEADPIPECWNGPFGRLSQVGFEL
jgi:hypothetical protein